MSNPVVTSVSPTPNATDIVLGQPIVVTFDQLINTDSINNATFALIGPNLSSIVTPEQIVEDTPVPQVGTGYTLGTFGFATIGGVTQVTFTPSRPLRTGVTYTVLIIGKDSPTAAVIGSYVMNLAGQPMLVSYQWKFTTGTLNVVTPPIQNPIPTSTTLDPNDIQIVPRAAVGNDLHTIDVIFPAPIDPTTFQLSDVLLGVEAILNDPDVFVNPGINASAIIQGNKLIITVTGL